MSKSILEHFNLLGVSKTAQAEEGTAANIDLALQIGSGNLLQAENLSETNADELNGKEEADEIYLLGRRTKLPLNFNKLQPHQAAFGLAYALGECTAANISGAAYKLTIKPMVDNFNPLFSSVQRFGQTINKRRALDLAIESLTLSVSDGWAQMQLEIAGSGRVEDTTIAQKITAPDDSAQLVLSSIVAGATDAEMLDNIHAVSAVLATGETVAVAVTGMDGVSKDMIDITAPGATAGDIVFKVVYVPTEAAWATLPTRTKESPLKITDFLFRKGGKWDGNALVGGIPVGVEFKSFEYKIQNSQSFAAGPKADVAELGTTKLAANYHGRDGRVQTISLGRQMRDHSWQIEAMEGDTFCLHLVAEGSEIEPGVPYRLELVFPKVAVLNAPIEVDGKKLAEKGDLHVMDDGVNGSVIAVINTKLDNLIN
jgi:hypothetical protein